MRFEPIMITEEVVVMMVPQLKTQKENPRAPKENLRKSKENQRKPKEHIRKPEETPREHTRSLAEARVRPLPMASLYRSSTRAVQELYRRFPLLRAHTVWPIAVWARSQGHSGP